MATRMVSLLDDELVPVGPTESGSVPPPSPDALPRILVGLVETAAIWVGLALIVLPFVFPFATTIAFIVMMTGCWLVAAGVVAALA